MSAVVRTGIWVFGAVLLASRGAWSQPACPGCQPVATNSSRATSCAEEDNVELALELPCPTGFSLEAVHPSYAIAADNCAADFTDCEDSNDETFPFAAANETVFDNGDFVVRAVREATFWRETGATVLVDDAVEQTDTHYVVVHKRIGSEDSWPEFLVLYADGHLRLKPQPAEGRLDNCYGSSVIVGPVSRDSTRTYSTISSISWRPATRSLEVAFQSGETGVIAIDLIDRQVARIHIDVEGASASAVFRSMYVADSNADADTVEWSPLNGDAQVASVLEFPGGPFLGPLKLMRRVLSTHNTSAPDLQLRFDDSLSCPAVDAGVGDADSGERDASDTNDSPAAGGSGSIDNSNGDVAGAGGAGSAAGGSGGGSGRSDPASEPVSIRQIDSDCSCRVPGPRGGSSWPLLGTLLAVMSLRRCKARRSSFYERGETSSSSSLEASLPLYSRHRLTASSSKA